MYLMIMPIMALELQKPGAMGYTCARRVSTETTMEIQHEKHDSVTLLRLMGRLDAVSAPETEQTFRDVVSDGATAVLIDLSEVEYMSSGGVRALIMLSRGLQTRQGTLKLCGLNPFVKQVFEISNLHMVFDIYPSPEDGLASFETA